VALKHKKHIKQKTVINFLLFFSKGRIKKAIRNATKFVPIANNCGFAVNVKNKKLGMHKIAKHIKILLFIFKLYFSCFKLRIATIINNNAANCKIEDNL
jgi:hypothetical protein